MAIEHWIGVATDIVNIISAVAAFVGDEREGMAPGSFDLGPVAFSLLPQHDSDTGESGDIYAQNTSTTKIGLMASSTSVNGEICNNSRGLQPLESINFSKWLKDNDIEEGKVSVVGWPSTAADVDWSSVVGTFARMPLRNIRQYSTGILAGVGMFGTVLKMDYNPGVGFSASLRFSPADQIAKIIAIYRDSSGGKGGGGGSETAVTGQKSSASGSPAGSFFDVTIPPNILARDEFDALTIVVDYL